MIPSKNMSRIIALLIIFIPPALLAQVYPASPANWRFPDGNPEGTKHVARRSYTQPVDSMIIKWSTPHISGDVKPLIGNIVNNPKLLIQFPFAPNEIVAMQGNELVIVDGAGNVTVTGDMPEFVNSVSVLFDTLSQYQAGNIVSPLVMGLETIEIAYPDDSLAVAYLAGYNHVDEEAQILKRLAIDLRIYDPNIFASIKPVYGRLNGNTVSVYTVVNMTKPILPGQPPINPPYFRGLTQFDADITLPTYPWPDIGDDIDFRITLGPDVNIGQPSLTNISPGKEAVLLPNYPNPSLDIEIDNPITFPTRADSPYLMSFDISNDKVLSEIEALDLSNLANGTRPYIRPYYFHLNNGVDNDSIYVLVTEQYRSIEGSNGRNYLHLYDSFGDPVTFPGDPIDPPIRGDTSHVWSVAAGDVDGVEDNAWLPFFPNNRGKEIILTKSSRNFSVSGNQLWIMRYFAGTEIEKPSPPGTTLFAFDTICTKRINGWVAAVNDLDGAPDRKEEILLVDGSTMMVVRMRDYEDVRFRLGQPFDTLFTYTFDSETISSAMISDMEGDGLNDIIITTFDSTYVIGNLLANTIEILIPIVQGFPPDSYCAGDTIPITWRNIMKGQTKIDINYQSVDDNLLPVGDQVNIAEMYDNYGDTVTYNYVADDLVLGTNGFFIVKGSFNPELIIDSTSILTFNNPVITLDPFADTVYKAGDELYISGTSNCVDSISFEYMPDMTVWSSLDTLYPLINGDFAAIINIPCMDIFRCDTADIDSLIRMRGVIYRSNLVSYTDTIFVKNAPAIFPVEYNTATTADPTKYFRWDLSETEFPCDTVSILISVDGGDNFGIIAEVSANEEEYTWLIPLDLPDDIIMRFCCNKSCIRTDTLITDYKPKFIDIVAPNPFTPPYEQLEIVYRVPEATNVTIRIFDQNNKLVAEPVRDLIRLPDIAYTDRWDGRIGDGSLAANGLYYITLIFSNGKREIYPVFVRK